MKSSSTSSSPSSSPLLISKISRSVLGWLLVLLLGNKACSSAVTILAGGGLLPLPLAAAAATWRSSGDRVRDGWEEGRSSLDIAAGLLRVSDVCRRELLWMAGLRSVFALCGRAVVRG